MKKILFILLILFLFFNCTKEIITIKEVCEGNSIENVESCEITDINDVIVIEIPVKDEEECKKFFYYIKQFHIQNLEKKEREETREENLIII